jgi:hypothetical protein
MKIWQSYGSEHSMNLVMIGRFKEELDAEEAKDLIEKITDFVMGIENFDHDLDRFPKEFRDFLIDNNLFCVSPHQLVQFIMEYSIEQNGNELRITTDEDDMSGIQRLMLNKGAKVEVFSAHDYPEDKKR